MQARLLRELNAVSSSKIGEIDFDTRKNAYISLVPHKFSSFKEEHVLTVLSHCIYDMSCTESVLRQCAYESLRSFIQFAASALDSNGEDCEDITNNSTWTKAGIQRIIKKIYLQNIGEAICKNISIQRVCSFAVTVLHCTLRIASDCCLAVCVFRNGLIFCGIWFIIFIKSQP